MRVPIRVTLTAMLFFALAFASLRDGGMLWALVIHFVAFLSVSIAFVVAFHRRSVAFYSYGIFFFFGWIIVESEPFVRLYSQALRAFQPTPGDWFVFILDRHIQILVGAVGFLAARLFLQYSGQDKECSSDQ